MKNIFIYGAPASGKSTLSKALGKALSMPVIDTDAEIVKAAGKSIADIFAQDGEPAFRDLESKVLQKCASSYNPIIISLGGGTLLREENRRFCEETGDVLCIETPSQEELERRLATAQGVRPLGDRSKERAAHYASFQQKVAAFFDLENSLVLIGSGIAKVFIEPKRTVFDSTVASLYPNLASAHLSIIPSGEANKTPQTIMNLWHDFAKAGIGRKDTVCACGGGVTGDLTGFAAATWMRGVQWRNFPTTLLSMVDASTGGKTGCDLPEGKNLAGAFHSPRLVVIDTDFLKTLPEDQLRSGRAEMLKHAIIGGISPKISQIPSAKEIAESLAVKIDIVKKDPFETKGLRLLLNCGHTVAHALETTLKYGISHGDAVAIGCLEEARQAVRLGLAPATWTEELKQSLVDAGLPTELPDSITFQSLAATMRGDKKRQGNTVTFALPCGWGDVRAVPIDL